MPLVPTASQTVGPYFRAALERTAWSDLVPDRTDGDAIRIEGRVLDGDGAPVPDALLELWQADDAFRGFGRACTDGEGAFWFRTAMPRAIGDEAPHGNLSIFARGLLRRLVTRVYFGDRAAENARDPLLAGIADERVRATLIALREERASGAAVYRFDVVLQGDAETAFLAI